MKTKWKIFWLLLILMLIFILFLFFLSSLNSSNLDSSYKNIIMKTFDSKNNQIIENKIEVAKLNNNLNETLSKDLKVVFCPGKDCFNIYNETLNDAKEEIVCAFYEFDFNNLSNVLKEKSKMGVNVSIITDNDYLNESGIINLKKTKVDIFSDIDRGTRYDNYMHDKFCVIDNKILITGSANPTNNDYLKNNNNIIKIDSKYLAENYRNEFFEMRSGSFGNNKHSTLTYNNITLKYENKSYLISSYMCPQDNCEQRVLEILNKSKKSIDMAAFSFTNENIENMLMEKSKLGVKVRGVVEKRNWNTQGSNTNNLSKQFFLINDTNKYTMHHKFFIVDNNWVITGSMNPTGAGVNYNDENILIIESADIAKLYQIEFEKLIY